MNKKRQLLSALAASALYFTSCVFPEIAKADVDDQIGQSHTWHLYVGVCKVVSVQSIKNHSNGEMEFDPVSYSDSCKPRVSWVDAAGPFYSWSDCQAAKHKYEYNNIDSLPKGSDSQNAHTVHNKHYMYTSSCKWLTKPQEDQTYALYPNPIPLSVLIKDGRWDGIP